VKIVNKTYKISLNTLLTVDNLEKIFRTAGCKPLRWAIVETDDQFYTMHAVVII
jgi:Tat protein secretion system quality control protein TatD with DNase activity